MLLFALLACGRPEPAAAPLPRPEPTAAAPDPGASGARLAPAGEPVRLAGVCEASGAAWVPEAGGPALWVVEDERPDAVMRFGPDLTPLGALPLRAPGGGAVELDDLESAARAGDGLWLLGSHSLNKSGKLKDRGHLVRVDSAGTLVYDSQAIRPTLQLPEALLRTAASACPGCALPPEAGTLPSKKGGLDIEGVAAMPERLLIGLRAPLVGGGKALVFAFETPAVGSGTFGASWALDLGGRGVRDLAWDAASGSVLVLAGPSGDEGPAPALYAWRPSETPELLGMLPEIPGEAPEALALGPTPGQLWVAWDAGNRLKDEIGEDFDCDALASRKGFAGWAHARAFRVDLGAR